MGKAVRTVHVNRLRPLLEPPQTPLLESPIPSANWCPPLFVHGEGSESPPVPSSASQAFLPPPVTTQSGRLGKTSQPLWRSCDSLTFVNSHI